MRRYLRPFLAPFSKQISQARSTVRIITPSPRHGLQLLLAGRSESRVEVQPDVFPFAAYLADRFACTHVILIGKPTARNLIHLHPQFKIIGFVPEAALASYRKHYAFGTWSKASFDSTSISDDVLKRAIIVCQDLEEFANPTEALTVLKTWLKHSPLCLLTSSGRWNQSELESLLRAQELIPEFIGLTASDNVNYEKQTVLAVITKDAVTHSATRITTPESFRVVAFMAAYNEADIIVQSIKKWTDQGVHVHVLENWSTDDTYELAKALESQLPVTVERFPLEGPTDVFVWGAMLARIEVLAQEIEANWFVRRGADEILVSPWPGISYRDGLYLVDRAGFNCVDHTIAEFHPVDNGFKQGMDHETYFKHFDLKHLSHPRQRKAWKNLGLPIATVPSAGHDVVFAGRRIYPFKFLVKHYSFRSQEQAERKVFRERKARWNRKERAIGWHIHYDGMQPGHRFVKRASEKETFIESEFNNNYLVERLSGVGIGQQTS